MCELWDPTQGMLVPSCYWLRGEDIKSRAKMAAADTCSYMPCFVTSPNLLTVVTMQRWSGVTQFLFNVVQRGGKKSNHFFECLSGVTGSLKPFPQSFLLLLLSCGSSCLLWLFLMVVHRWNPIAAPVLGDLGPWCRAWWMGAPTLFRWGACGSHMVPMVRWTKQYLGIAMAIKTIQSSLGLCYCHLDSYRRSSGALLV